MKHTPGPWEYEDNSIIALFEKEIVQLCAMSRTSWSQPDYGKNHRLAEQTKANARLIAAAPEMLEALKLLMLKEKQLEHTPGDFFIFRLKRTDLEMIANAIAKAEGD